MLRDKIAVVILCLAGSLISAGMKKIIIDLMTTTWSMPLFPPVRILSIKFFFEALGFKHYHGRPIRRQQLKI